MILLHAIVAALYAVAAWAGWSRAIEIPPAAARAAVWLVPAALVLHAIVIAHAIFTPEGLDLSLPNALSLVEGLSVLIAWASGVLATLPRVGAVVLPIAALCAMLPAVWSSPLRFAYTGERWAPAHIAVALVAYALFVVAALQTLVLTGLEKRLHRGQSVTGGETPPLLTLELYLFRLIAAGVVLLTFVLGSGILFSEQVFGKPLTFNYKNIFSVAGWLVFAVLLFGPWRSGWRGGRGVLRSPRGTVVRPP